MTEKKLQQFFLTIFKKSAVNHTKHIGLKRNISFVDITTISRQALNKPEYFANDGLHFSGAMHQLWVDEIMTLF